MHPISKEEINAVARCISDGPLGLAHPAPEEGAEAHRCFENAAAKAARDGGQVKFGWPSTRARSRASRDQDTSLFRIMRCGMRRTGVLWT